MAKISAGGPQKTTKSQIAAAAKPQSQQTTQQPRHYQHILSQHQHLSSYVENSLHQSTKDHSLPISNRSIMYSGGQQPQRYSQSTLLKELESRRNKSMNSSRTEVVNEYKIAVLKMQ